MQKNIPKLDSLTGLRFYLAFLVLICHTLKVFYYRDNCLGIIGVSMFFILSGFILFYNYFPTADSKLDIPRFFTARLARIYPVFFVTMLLGFDFSHFHVDLNYWLCFARQIFLIQSWWEDSRWSFNSVAWTVSVEAFFYAVFPILGLFIFRSKKPFIYFMLSLCALITYTLFLLLFFCCDSYIYDLTFPVNRLIEFLCGMFVGWLYVSYPQFLSHIKVGKVLQSSLFVVILSLFYLMTWIQAVSSTTIYFGHQYNLYYLIPGCLIIYTLAWVERQGILWRIATCPLAILGGEISYALYLLHNQLLCMLAIGFKYIYHISLSDMSSPAYSYPISSYQLWGRLIFSIIGIFASILGAYCLYYWIERPMRKKIMNGFDNWRKHKHNIIHLNLNPSLKSTQRHQQK